MLEGEARLPPKLLPGSEGGRRASLGVFSKASGGLFARGMWVVGASRLAGSRTGKDIVDTGAATQTDAWERDVDLGQW